MNNTRCWVEINKYNFQYNLKNLMTYLGNDTKIIGVVKADYYGHSALITSKLLKENGINDFAVAAVYEAIQLREYGIVDPILILSYVDSDQLEIAYKNGFIVTVVDYQHALKLNEWAKEKNIKLTVEIKVNTGMNRLGVSYDIDIEKIKEMYSLSNLIINGTYSHLCCADSFENDDIEWTNIQKERFDNFLNKVKQVNCNYGRTHLCASSGIVNYPQFKYDFVRPGFLLLGYKVGNIKDTIKTLPVLSWKSKVEMVHIVKKGQPIGYSRNFIASKDMKVATISVGYADGYPREYSNKGFMLIHGQKANIVGNVCMDQMMVDVTDIDDVKCEDIVTLIGKDGQLEITMNQFSEKINTIGDEIGSLIAPRVERIAI